MFTTARTFYSLLRTLLVVALSVPSLLRVRHDVVIYVPVVVHLVVRAHLCGTVEHCQLVLCCRRLLLGHHVTQITHPTILVVYSAFGLLLGVLRIVKFTA